MPDVLANMFKLFCNSVFHDEHGNFQENPTISLDPKITTQDDPFDRWVVRYIESLDLPKFNIYNAGPLTHPDTVIQYTKEDDSIEYVGLEIKKLNANEQGKDPRGMTIDYNSTVPCGTFRVYTENGWHIDVKGYYLFALLDHKINEMERKVYTFILADGDLLNDDLSIYLDSKTANVSEYNHGPYGEGSIRRRAMYLYPNPLDSNIPELSNQVSLIHASKDLENYFSDLIMTHSVKRTKKDGEVRYFYIYKHRNAVQQPKEVPEITLFDRCAQRKPRKRSAYKFILKE